MAKIGIIGIPGNGSSEKLAEIAEKKTGFRRLIDMGQVSFEMEKGRILAGDMDLSTLDALIIKKIGSEYSPFFLDRLEILRYLGCNGMKIFSNPEKIMRLLNRLNCTVRLKQGNIPIPPTVVTENLDLAVEALENYGKAVLKPLFTSKARGMRLLDSSNGARNEIENFQQSGNRVIYLQKFVPIPGRDIGVVFLGGEYVATYARVQEEGSWNTTTHFGGRYEPYTPSDHIVALARKAQSLFGLDFTCVDIVETADGPMVFEVSAFGGFRGLWEAHRIDAAELYINHVMGILKNG